MAKAGIVTGYIHKCRRTGCGYSEKAPDGALRRCPKHAETPGPKMWAVPQVRRIRFHDLRHTTATLLLKAKVPLAVVQRILRHSDPRITSEVYGHLDLADLQAGVDHLHFGVEAQPIERQVRVVNAAPFAAPVQRQPQTAQTSKTAIPETLDVQGFDWRAMQDSNLRPTAPEAVALSS